MTADPSRKTAAKHRPKLRPQPHGGALLSGGKSGNRGGPGRPPEYLRALSRYAYERIILEIGRRDLSSLSAHELSQLASATGRYGLGADAATNAADFAVEFVLNIPKPPFARASITGPATPSTAEVGVEDVQSALKTQDDQRNDEVQDVMEVEPKEVEVAETDISSFAVVPFAT